MDDIANRFGRNVYWHRVDQGRTYRDLSEASGVAYSFLSSIEKGGQNPSLRHAVAIAEALNIGLAELVFGDAFDDQGEG